MDYKSSPFHRFFGWKILALLAVLAAYTYWYTGPGYFGQINDMAPGIPVQSLHFYAGHYPVEVYAALTDPQKHKMLLAFIFDLPFMILLMLVTEALIAFGTRHLKLGPKSNLLFVLPIAFLICDFGEDSFLALTLFGGGAITGWCAAMFTPLKFLFFYSACIIGILMGAAGLLSWFRTQSRS
ncbi:MAG: hypothetical protein HKN36_10965 [Hellea sp.]|nr:hypothetical protein [Hellea sp.]